MSAIDRIIEHLLVHKDAVNSALTLAVLQEWSFQLDVRIHVAVMVEPYLSKICSGEKYIESRLTKVNISPYGRADSGDVIVFKRSGGPVCAVAEVAQTHFEEFGWRRSPHELADEYAAGLGYEPGYIESKSEAQYASLLWLANVKAVPTVALAKSGRQAWVTLAPSPSSGSLFGHEHARLF